VSATLRAWKTGRNGAWESDDLASLPQPEVNSWSASVYRWGRSQKTPQFLGTFRNLVALPSINSGEGVIGKAGTW